MHAASSSEFISFITTGKIHNHKSLNSLQTAADSAEFISFIATAKIHNHKSLNSLQTAAGSSEFISFITQPDFTTPQIPQLPANRRRFIGIHQFHHYARFHNATNPSTPCKPPPIHRNSSVSSPQPNFTTPQIPQFIGIHQFHHNTQI